MDSFSNGRNICKVCREAQAKARREAKMKKDMVAFKCHQMSASAYSRVFAKSKEHKKGYRGIEEPYGFNNIKDMSDFLYSNFYDEVNNLLKSGKVPSVDRIDSSKGYTKENIRILDFKENTLRGVANRMSRVRVVAPDGSTKEYPSIISCSKDFGRSETSVRGWLGRKKGYVIPEGYQFYYIDK